MCRIGKHICLWNKHNVEYECNTYDWACPVINVDEDSNICDACMTQIGLEMYEFEQE